MKNTIIVLFFAAFFAANAFSQTATAQVPVKVNVGATVSIQPDDGVEGEGDTQSVTANTEKTLTLQLKYTGGGGGDVSPILSQQAKAPVVSFSRGTVSLELHQQTFKNADISLFSINGKQVLRGRSSMSANLPEGVYVLSVKGTNGKFFSSKLAHGGGKLSINVSFGGEASSSGNILRKAGDYGSWVVTAKAEGYRDTMYAFHPDEGTNPTQNITLTQLKSGEISVALACLDLQSSVVRGSEISVPEVKCSDNSTPSDISWTGRPGGNGTWATSTGSSTASYTIGVTAKCGGESLTASCGTVNVVAAASSSSAATASSSSTTTTSSSSRASSSSSGVFVPHTPANFTETVNGVSFDMIYIPGGTFKLGCESGNCPADTSPVDAEVSPYFIMKSEVSGALWRAVMGSGGSSSTSPYASFDFYKAMEFACKLSELTGKKYHMQTEAEFEYAAKNHRSSLEHIGGGTAHGEWAFNSWLGTHTGGKDPVGTTPNSHTQKTRRDPSTVSDRITGRLIRSIEGEGPGLRLVVSNSFDYPPGMNSPCDIKAPHIDESGNVNSYRDKRWITGSDKKWKAGSIAIGSFDLTVWEDGTAKLGSTNGQWFTSNNIAFVFVPSSGTPTKFAYIFLDDTQGSVISDKSFMSGGFIGRYEQTTASTTKPSVTLAASAEALAQSQSNFATEYKMIDMVNVPAADRKQDSRLLDGTSNGWFQDNRSAGGTHHYRKDIDEDEFRFTVNENGQRIMISNGTWYTVNNTLLVVTKGNYTVHYLYTIAGGTFYHNSFQGYERGDFRMFEKTANNSSVFDATCGQSVCGGEIPKNQSASMYANQEKGQSTYVPVPCPTGGCR